MRIFNIGIIGYGGFGKFLHHSWRHLENVCLIAIADPIATKTQSLGAIKVFANWRDMLSEKNIDLIAIVTEPNTHEMIATACMQAGKHVLIEKPLSVSISDAENILRVRDKTKMVAGIDFIMRFNPLLQALQSLGQQNIFGKLRRVDVENYAQDEQLPPEHWFWNWDRSGGILIEHAVHFIDLVHFLSPAKIVSVNGLKHDRNPRQEDQAMANVLYEGGLIATHYHSFARPGFFETTNIKLAYDLADISLQGWIPLSGNVKALVNPTTKAILLSNPLFKQTDTVPIDMANDESRPDGWGITENVSQTPPNTLRSGGVNYEVNEMITGIFQIGKLKQVVYADCVAASLLDVLKKIENPDHNLCAPLEYGLKSLDVAVRATEDARKTP